jgi:hypothetical protein
MLRFDDCLCGTTTTGTGTLTLAAIPSGAGGGINPDVWARATGVGFGNSAAILVDYVLTEYTDNTFATEKSKEAGTGTLTLGGSSGITNCTLGRTTLDWTATALDTQPAVVSVKPGTGISVGTAANTLVMIAPRAEGIPAFEPYFNTAGSDTNWGVCPEGIGSVSPGAAQLFSAGTNYDVYLPFRCSVPMLVKRCSWRMSTYSSVVGSPTVSARIYAFNSSGQPGKLLYDFTPSSGVTINATGAFSSGAAGNGFLLLPGDYLLDMALVGLTSGTVQFTGPSQQYLQSGFSACYRLGAVSGALPMSAYSSGAVAGAAPDPANVSGWTLNTNGIQPFVFGLSPT